MWLSLNTIFALLLAVWVFIDARARMNHVGWAVLTLLFGPIILVADGYLLDSGDHKM